eukprot:9008263-Prorocentrum_lima.AAC.1
MTSSLVGSEMCIRDRNTEHQTPITEHRSPNTEHRIPNAERRTPNTEHRTCLLYTSDAADDM